MREKLSKEEASKFLNSLRKLSGMAAEELDNGQEEDALTSWDLMQSDLNKLEAFFDDLQEQVDQRNGE